MKINKNILLVILTVSFLLTSCKLINKDDSGDYVARVNDHYLTQEDLNDVMNDAVIADTASFVQNYINNWATSQLLLDGAMRNVGKPVQEDFEKLVANYRRDLYTKYYSDVLIDSNLDSLVSDDEALQFYENNKENFKLNEQLLQFKFIHVDEDYEAKEIEKYLVGEEKEDEAALDSLKFQFKSYFLNDSIWVKRSAVIQQVNPITVDNAPSVLKKSNFIQLRDSLGLYLIAVKRTLDRNEMAPLQYVRPTINQIIINKRKLALIKKLEKEIKDDAIKNKEFEIYD
ncbi:peptidyl-prolyl cis-trans isomerase [Dokdonia sp. Hel_I_53]|uniref:peptidyl-prolyl cis-trans isomerase n=1 Tax=Dokdonia sp. Hel_I_53 TaxID=1566287 RepID=UPI001198FC6A|nr:peptidyl-prolyl cis-trans isomerase [Dokdonia sp. Hel_I_53]TVZ51275.1 hypothetical protein OD90_0412 [Dokdonia sp. Hel_I_53]